MFKTVVKVTHDGQLLKRKRLNLLSWFLGFIIAVGIGIALFFVFPYPTYRDNVIAQNQNLQIITAQVTGSSMGGDGRYSINFSYVDPYSGQTVHAASRFVYSIATRNRIIQAGEKYIRVQNGNAIDINFRTRYYRGFMHVFSMVFLVGAIASLGLVIFNFIKYLQFAKVVKRGKNDTASFVSHAQAGGSDSYQIKFSYVNANGVPKTVDSSVSYSASVVAAAKDMKQIPVKIYGEAAILLIDPLNQHFINNRDKLQKEVSSIASGMTSFLSLSVDANAVADDIFGMFKGVLGEDAFEDLCDDASEEENSAKDFVSNECPNCSGRLNITDRNNKCCPFCGTKWVR